MTKKIKAATTRPTTQDLQGRIDKAVKLAKNSMWFMEYPDNNHTMYFLDQMVRVLLADGYRKVIGDELWDTGEKPDYHYYNSRA
ncbi:hypothetical protein A2704_01135 [Candidatus Kaiserbacteria bacterium RIFCSPHIGHO2_01_FULL_54_36b]|uniref:Uncharacterized protein n=1 Tax=Candidatus Kaiserbacteria bacterium RIFCSPHIGHO2_01_FULL_54_36b TaxID=1798483 RepID=A0A1F6CJG2_9BACT|nr:MAG: hypothetical protein A2704_01135 [Candidatus Kaiserbacteria bacterium RIFCSPHIGHO2_01_FULL_54_36b]